MKDKKTFSTDKGFLKWMISSGGPIFIGLPRGILLILAIGRAFLFGTVADVVFDFFVSLVAYYLVFLVIKWKENQIKKDVSAVSDKNRTIIAIAVVVVLLAFIFLT